MTNTSQITTQRKGGSVVEKKEIEINGKEYSVYTDGRHKNGRNLIVEVYDAEKMVLVPLTRKIQKAVDKEFEDEIIDPEEMEEIYENMAREEGW